MSRYAPSWQETSIQWLRTHHKALSPATSIKSWTDQLDMALWRMNFRRKDLIEGKGWTKPQWREALSELAEGWTPEAHAEMCEFLADGGYTHVKAVVVSAPDGSFEKIEIEMDEVESAAVAALAPPPQMSPDHELEAIVEAAALQSDPRAGVW